MPNRINVLMVKPGEKPYTAEIDNDLKSMQQAVDGYIEVVSMGGGVLMVCNEEGKLIGLPGNRRIYTGDIIAGNFFLARDDGQGGFASLTDEQMAVYNDRFQKIEYYKLEQVEDTMGIEFQGW